MSPGTTRQDGQDSKRQLLSTASRVFDPVGCLAPFTVMAKIPFQSLWQLRVSWDEPLPEDVERHWNRWKRDMAELSLIRVPRALVPVTLAQVNWIELHAFCDASERAYGAVVYLRLETSGRLTLVNFITAKTHVAPVKRLNLPRLEIMGALLAAQGEERTTRHATLAVMMEIEKLFRISAYCLRNLDAAGAKGRVQSRNQNTPQGGPSDGAQPHRPARSLPNESRMLCMGSRLENADLPASMRHPAIFPGKHELTMGLIRRYHLRQLHARTDQMLATLRQHYWVPKGRRQVKKVTRGCLSCRRVAAKPAQPRLAALPRDQDGLRRTIVRLNGKEDYVTKIRVPDHVHGHSRRAPGVAPPDDHGQSIASTSSIYGKERQARDHPNRQLLLIQKRRLRTPPVAVSGGCEQSSKGTREASHQLEVHPRKSPVDGRLLGAPGLLSQGVIKKGPCSGIAGRRRTQDASLPFQLLTGREYVDFPAVEDNDPDWHSARRGPPHWESRWRYRQQLMAKWWRRWRSEYLVTLLPREKWSRDERQLSSSVMPAGSGGQTFAGRDGVNRTARIQTSTTEITRPVAKLVVLGSAIEGNGRATLPSGGGCSGRNGRGTVAKNMWDSNHSMIIVGSIESVGCVGGWIEGVMSTAPSFNKVCVSTVWSCLLSRSDLNVSQVAVG
ncbi:hypothetical protein T11_16111 [Trichinella zimbabwensis]|uniref:Integrase zinc-binding domain-containing protein n=1 Tax=Trichinella zimbabwensis TaxID=268475 RepID=A0A0V1HCU1_9BILA|nr:hypothetical protein T11_16111 [Trichinella zimbabwensis]